MGLRVSEEEEIVGVDVSQHGERAYAEAITSSLEPLMVPSHSLSVITVIFQVGRRFDHLIFPGG